MSQEFTKPKAATTSEAKVLHRNSSTLPQLPAVLTSYILEFLNPMDLSNSSLISKTHNTLVQSVARKKIQKEFKLTIPSSADLLPTTIYEQLKVFTTFSTFYQLSYLANDSALFQATENNHLTRPELYACLNKASAVGNLRKVKYLTSQERGVDRIFPTQETIDLAAASHNLKLLQYLDMQSRWNDAAGELSLKSDVSCNSETLVRAIISRNYAAVEWLTLRSSMPVAAEEVHHKAAAGDLRIMKLLMRGLAKKRFMPTKVILDQTVASGDIPATEWLLQQLMNQAEIDNAARLGDFSQVRHLMSRRGSFKAYPSFTTSSHAKRSGNQALINWINSPERGDQQAPEIENLSWPTFVANLIRESMLAPDNDTLNMAALSGNKDLFTSLVETYKLIPNENSLTYATRSGNKELLKLCIEIYKIHPTSALLINTADSAKQEVIEWLMNTYDLLLSPPVLASAARGGNLAVMQWLILEKGFLPDHLTLIYAAQAVNISGLVWLIREYPQLANEDTWYHVDEHHGSSLVEYLKNPQGPKPLAILILDLEPKTYRERSSIEEQKPIPSPTSQSRAAGSASPSHTAPSAALFTKASFATASTGQQHSLSLSLNLSTSGK